MTITILSFRELMETDIAAALKRIPFAEYPPELLAARRARFVEAVRADPRTAEEIDADEWDADWHATNESNRP